MSKKKELIELIFENFPITNIDIILTDLIKTNANIIDYQIIDNGDINFDESKFNIQINNFNKINDIFRNRYTRTVIINAKKIYINFDKYLENVSINIREVKNDIYFFEFNFYSNETSFNNLIELANELIDFSSKIANKYSIEKYYCGIEPADIENDRLFTNTKFGEYYYLNDGDDCDVNGSPLKNAKDPAAHIPLDQFDVKKMPKF